MSDDSKRRFGKSLIDDIRRYESIQKIPLGGKKGKKTNGKKNAEEQSKADKLSTELGAKSRTNSKTLGARYTGDDEEPEEQGKFGAHDHRVVRRYSDKFWEGIL